MGAEQVARSMKVLELKGNRCRWVDRIVVLEPKLNIYLNERKIISIPCTPKDEKLLAIGYLQSEGFIASREELVEVETAEEEYAVSVTTKTGNNGFSPTQRLVKKDVLRPDDGALLSPFQDHKIRNEKRECGKYSKLGLSGSAIIELLIKFKDISLLYKKTRAVHSAAIASVRNILFFYEDIGRHNVIDKVMGRCMIDALPTRDKILVMSGRITMEIVQKVRRTDIPVILSKAIATEKAIRYAAQAEITLIGCLQDKSVVIYTNPFQ